MNHKEYILIVIKLMKKEQHVQSVFLDMKLEKRGIVLIPLIVKKKKMEFV